MDLEKRANQIKAFLEKFYTDDLYDAKTRTNGYVTIDFSDIITYDPDLGEDFLECPYDCLKLCAIQTEKICEQEIPVRIKNIPKSQHVRIRDLRSKHLGKLISIKGLVRQKSDVRPLIICIKYECPSCGNIIPLLQHDKTIKKPRKCGCGNKGFREGSKEIVDAQNMVLEELTEELTGGEQPKRVNVFLKEDLVTPISDKKTIPGTSVEVTGVLKEVPVGKGKSKSTLLDVIFQGIHVENIEQDFSEVAISKKDLKEIEALCKKDPYELLKTNIAPNIYGHDLVKEALLLQLFGGVKKDAGKQGYRRGDTHILLCGEPGTGKSFLLKRMESLSPKARFVSGKSTTGAGLIASVVKDEFTGSWGLEAGAMVLANGGMLLADEFEKMSKEDRSAMHEALERQQVNLSKANVRCTLQTQASVLAAANPKKGRFDHYEPISTQIDLPSSLINRFDLIFVMKDLPDEEKDAHTADFILRVHEQQGKVETVVESDLIKKYVAYAKQNIKPKLSKSAMKHIKDYYLRLRKMGQRVDGENQNPIPISARQLEALIRLSEASARTRLCETVEDIDAERAINLLHSCLVDIGMDPETGKIDIDRLGNKSTATQRGKARTLINILHELKKEYNSIPQDIIEERALEKNISAIDTEKLLSKLKRSGDIFEQRNGLWKLI